MIFTFSPYTIVYGESIVFVQIFEFEFLVDIPILVRPESEKVVFRVMSVCLCVCVGGGMCARLEPRLIFMRYVGNNQWYLQVFFHFFQFFIFRGILPPKND
jgi:hypothetical protein